MKNFALNTMPYKKLVSISCLLAGGLLLTRPTQAQLTTCYPNDLANRDKWYPYDSGALFGRTYMSGVTSNNSDGEPNPKIGGGSAYFKLHTFNKEKYAQKDRNGKPLMFFQGTELTKNPPFILPPKGSDTRIFRARIKINSLPAGAVFGFFAVQEGAAPNQDEIDFEFLGNLISATPSQNQLWLNIFKRNPGATQASQLSGQQATPVAINPVSQWHTYTIRWSEKSVDWFVDDVVEPGKRDSSGASSKTSVKRSVAPSLVPTNPLQVHLNAWVPDANFPEAYSEGLMPSTSLATSPYNYEVKWVQIGDGAKAKGKAKVIVKP